MINITSPLFLQFGRITMYHAFKDQSVSCSSYLSHFSSPFDMAGLKFLLLPMMDTSENTYSASIIRTSPRGLWSVNTICWPQFLIFPPAHEPFLVLPSAARLITQTQYPYRLTSLSNAPSHLPCLCWCCSLSTYCLGQLRGFGSWTLLNANQLLLLDW